MRSALCIPILNAGRFAEDFLEAIKLQEFRPDQIIVLDSGSTDGSPELFKKAGLRVESIPAEQFDHGLTRQLAVDMAGDVDIFAFLTQDAILADSRALSSLFACFLDGEVGVAYGRQLPRQNAGTIESHARLYNYPEKSQKRSARDIPHSGIKTAFISNSFAAYRGPALSDAGGFPSVIMGEDVCVAAKMLLLGWKIAYSAEAQVFHSHQYTMMQEFRRYFDIGVFHARESWLIQEMGGAGGEGWRFVDSEMRYLWKHSPSLIPSAMMRDAFKLAGYKMGKWEKILPASIKRRLGMHGQYWNQARSTI